MTFFILKIILKMNTLIQKLILKIKKIPFLRISKHYFDKKKNNNNYYYFIGAVIHLTQKYKN